MQLKRGWSAGNTLSNSSLEGKSSFPLRGSRTLESGAGWLGRPQAHRKILQCRQEGSAAPLSAGASSHASQNTSTDLAAARGLLFRVLRYAMAVKSVKGP